MDGTLGMELFRLFGFEILIMAICAAATVLLITIWRHREIRGMEERTLKTLLSMALGVGIVVVTGALCNVPGWLFLLNTVIAAVIGYTVVAKFPSPDQVTDFLKTWSGNGSKAGVQPEPHNAGTPLSAIPALKNIFATDLSGRKQPLRGDAPETGITYLRKMRALRSNY